MRKEIKDRFKAGDSPFRIGSARAFLQAQQEQSLGDYSKEPSYPRSGSPALFRLERQLSRLAGAEDSHFLGTNSGMSSLVMGCELAGLTAGDAVLFGPTLYGRSESYLSEFLSLRGVKGCSLESVRGDDLAAEVAEFKLNNPLNKIKAVVLETVGNGPDMPVVNVPEILDLPVWQDDEPLFVLDNTLATNTGIPLVGFLRERPQVRAVGVESLTKFYRQNQGLAGSIYSYNPQINELLWRYRTVLGYTPDPAVVECMVEEIPETREEFDYRNKRSFENTYQLAWACHRVLDSRRFWVSYPGLVDHPDYDLATHYDSSAQIAPVFFITSKTDSVKELFTRLDEIGGLDKLQISDSFGFEQSSVYYNDRYGGYLRIAGGREDCGSLNEAIETLVWGLNKATH